MVTKRAKVGVEDEVGLVALAREEAIHSLKGESGEPRGFEKEVITKGEVNGVVLMGWELMFREFRGYFAGKWSLVNGQLCGSCGGEKVIEVGGAPFGDTVRASLPGKSACPLIQVKRMAMCFRCWRRCHMRLYQRAKELLLVVKGGE